MKNIIIIAVIIMSFMNADARTISKKTLVEPDAMPANTEVAKSVEQKKQICKRVLDYCVADKVLDKNGVKCYKRLKKIDDLGMYVELILECAQEDKFWDSVTGTDAWDNFVTYIMVILED